MSITSLSRSTSNMFNAAPLVLVPLPGNFCCVVILPDSLLLQDFLAEHLPSHLSPFGQFGFLSIFTTDSLETALVGAFSPKSAMMVSSSLASESMATEITVSGEEHPAAFAVDDEGTTASI